MADYKITQVSNNPPTEWYDKAHNSTIYYIRVMLEGHPKPVEIGKKKPDALKVGMTISGDIKPDSGPADKFKGAPMQQSSGGASGGSSNYQPKDEHAIAKAVALKAAVDLHASTAKKDTNLVLADADMFLEWLESDKKLDTSPDPMNGVHAQNPMNQAAVEEFVGEPFNTQDLPPGF
jgi:hypothetical protein